MEGDPPKLSKRDEEMAQRYGGADKDDYETPDTTHYADKPDHYARSCYHQPQHLEHKIKEEDGHVR